MESELPIDSGLTPADILVLQNLLRDVDTEEYEKRHDSARDSPVSDTPPPVNRGPGWNDDPYKNFDDKSVVQAMEAMNDPNHTDFEPSVFILWDLRVLEKRLPPFVSEYLLRPYVHWARSIVRVETDVVMLTHLILYFTTTVPSAILLFYHFTWPHAIFHWLMQSYYVGTYNLMMHQHIHMRGILAKKYWWIDLSFPYILDPLFGHTWNTYFYHHVKHHHVEANGPDDLSSTIRYQRDEILHLLHYIGRFFFLIWMDLPRYFLRKGQPGYAVRAGISEISTWGLYYALGSYNFRATLFTVLLEFTLLRIGLMVGNWGQHAFVDELEPDSDFRSSITLVDTASNRFCFNDGYHTSHHLNPLRHWRQHPVSFIKQKMQYAEEHALVFRNIDYIMITIRLMMKDYKHLARCLVPIGEQRKLSMEERAAMLETKTRRFTEEDIVKKFSKA